MLNVRFAGVHLYGKLLFTWLSLVMSMVVSFCAVLFPTRCLGEILDLSESVSGGFPTYSYKLQSEQICHSRPNHQIYQSRPTTVNNNLVTRDINADMK